MMKERYAMRGLLRIAAGLALTAIVAACNASGAPEGAKITTSGAGVTPPAPTAYATASNAYAGPYTVVPGDTVYGIAQRLNVPVRSLIDANGLKPPYRLQPGQQLAMPGSSGGTYDPDLAVTAPQPATTYGNNSAGGDTDGTYTEAPPRVTTSTGGSIAMEDLAPAAGGSNTAAQPRTSTATAAPATTAAPAATEEPGGGDVPLVPGVKPAAPSAATVAPPSGATAEAPEVAAIPDTAKTDGQFQWPLQGKVISRFGAKIGGQHNDGINIAAHAGDKVLAAGSGVVAYSGNELKGFGNLLLIRHANGWITAYAHNQKLLVKKGDKVKSGQPIATVGATGNVDSPQLHFEIRRGSDPVDPLQHLASQG